MTGQEEETLGIATVADSIRTAQPGLDSHFRKHAGVRRGGINHAQGVCRVNRQSHTLPQIHTHADH